ncbi:MAG: hypothetical protein R3B13_17965 [Polyangiaceae bacterium]
MARSLLTTALLVAGLASPAAAAPLPDLVLEALQVDAACRIVLRIKNAGGPIDAESYAAAQLAVDAGLSLSQISLRDIDPGASLRVPGRTLRHVLKSALPSAGSVRVTLDDNHVVHERSEANNTRKVAVPARCWELTRNKKASLTPMFKPVFQLKPATVTVQQADRRFDVSLATSVEPDARWYWTATLRNTGNVALPSGAVLLEGSQRSPYKTSPASGGFTPWSLAPGQARTVKLSFSPCAYAYQLTLAAKDAQTSATLQSASVALPSVRGSDFDVHIAFDQPTKQRRISVVNRAAVPVRITTQCVFRDATSVYQGNWTEKACGGLEMVLRPHQGQAFAGPVPEWKPGMRGVIFAMIYRKQDASICAGKAMERLAVESLILPIIGWQPDA